MNKTAGIEITEYCNFRCIHCYLGEKNVHMLSSEQFSMVVDELENEGFLTLYLTGGEPLTHPEFCELYKIAKLRGFFVDVLTNGSLLSGKILECLTELPPHSIEISIYAMKSETLAKVTGCKKLDIARGIVLNNAIEAHSRGIPVILKYVLMKQNVEELPPFLKLCSEHQIEYKIQVANLPQYTKNGLNVDFRLSPKVLGQLIKQYNLPINVTADGNGHKCDAGKSVYITATGCICGCPITRSVGYYLDPKQENRLSDYMQVLTHYYSQYENKLCPGWLALEPEENIKKYLTDIEYYSNNS